MRVVVTNQQWETVLAHHDTCMLLGAKVEGSKLLLNQGDSAVICPRGESEVQVDFQVGPVRCVPCSSMALLCVMIGRWTVILWLAMRMNIHICRMHV